MNEFTFEDLTPEQQQVLNAAEEAMAEGFNPRSNFVVGGAVLTKSGKIYKGANLTISTTGMTACAEVGAFMAASLEGERDIVAIATIANNNGHAIDEPNNPCGRCRQIIYEFSQLAGASIELVYSNTDKSRVIVAPIDAYLPAPFASGIFRERK